MVRALLVRGMVVGLVAGLLAFGVGRLVGEPQVDRAIAFEAAMDEAKAKADVAKGMPATAPEPELVSREVQAGLGLFTGVVVYSAAFGGLFALVFAVAYGRVGNLRPRAVSALLALGGFLTLYVVPSLKYPASPPSVGRAETIGYRSGLYFLMILISVVAAIAATMIGRRLVVRYGGWNAVLLGAASFVVIIAIAQLLLPDINEVPEQFPAVILWRFRVASLGIELILWTTLGLLFGAVADRLLSNRYDVARDALS